MTVQIQLRSVDQFVDTSNRWNSNDEIASILLSAQSHPDWLQTELELRPPSGKLILYRRKDGSYYKQDGYSWKKRKDGKLAREDHMKLKVMGVELIHANYVHSALVPTFHRRAYWMLTYPEIVLVHYLNASYEEATTDCRPLADKIISCLRSNCADMSPHEILIQLTPMLSNTFSPAELDRLCRMAEQQPDTTHSPASGTMLIQMVTSSANNDTQPLVLSVHSAQIVANSFQPKISTHMQQNTPRELNSNCSIIANNNAVLEVASQVASTLHSPLCRSSSCSSASRRGLSSLAMRRQPSTFSDSVGQELIGGILNEYAPQSHPSDCCGGAAATVQQVEADDSAYCSFSADQRTHPDATVAHTPPVPNAEQYRQPATERSRTDSFGSNRVSLWETSSNASNLPLVEITDYSPEWSYPEGGVKILVSGPWYLRGHEYSAVFDGLSVPAVLIQAGVLRCFCPAHSPASVQLSIACDGQIISTSATFTYLDRVNHVKQSSSNSQQNAIVDAIVARLENLEQFLNLNETSSTTAIQPNQSSSSQSLEDRFVAICERMKCCRWKQEQQPLAAPLETTLLHFAALLGFDRLIEAILRWRAENPPPVVVRDFDVLGRDSNGRTPLHLSALNGHVRCVTLIARVCPHAVDVVDDRGETPAELALKNGQKRVAALIGQLVRRRGAVSSSSKERYDRRAGGDHVDSTALWVLTNGETVTDEQRLESISGKPPMVPRRSHVFRHQQTIDAPENMRKQNGTRERTKRASVECLEELLMDSGEDRESSFAPPDDVSSIDDDELSDLENDSWLKEPLSVDIPMDVHVPDSPKTAQMWEAVTSPGVVANEGARAQIASLAQQIIDALPQRIKQKVMHFEPSADRQISTDLSDQSPSGLSGHSKNPFLPSASAGVDSSSDWEDLNMLMSPLGGALNHFRFVGSDGVNNSNDPLDVFSPPLVTTGSFGGDGQSIGRSVDSLPPVVVDPTASAKDLGEFFNADDSRNSPLDRHFQDLRLSDREQRELYEAAKIIQTAYRQYKARITNQKQLDAERTAAVVIQSYYRRYKQFCYFKKLHKAAVLIQKHFRLNKANKQAEITVGDTPSNASCIRLEVPPNANVQLWRQHLAAIRIQHAFRGHYMRKRQAAARKIQKFMRESKQNAALELLIAEGSQVKRPRLHADGGDGGDGDDRTGDIEDAKCADELADWDNHACRSDRSRTRGTKMMRRLGSNVRYNPASRSVSEAASAYSDTISRETQSFRELEMGLSDYSAVKTNSSLSQRSSPDRDSGISDNGSTVTVEKRELGSQAAQICQELTTIVHLNADFLRDVMEGKESASDLLDELEHKIHPFLITLDEEMANIEQLLRKNLDRSRIGDSKVGWLLEYNRYQLEFRRVLSDLSGPVYEDLERVLRLRDRGCLGLAPKKETVSCLREMSAGLERAAKLIRNERSKPETAY